MEQTNLNTLLQRLNDYKRKHYLNIIIRGAIFFIAMLISIYLLFNTLEFFAQFGSTPRTILFYGFWVVALGGLALWVIRPLLQLAAIGDQVSDEEVARQIGAHFPEVKDKLINILQLNRTTGSENALIEASIAQKTQAISVVPFAQAINLSHNYRYVKYAAIPAALLLLILLFVPQVITQSTGRIIDYSHDYRPLRPFDFQLTNDDLTAFYNEDYTLELLTPGQAVPNEVILISNGRKITMERSANGKFTHRFTNLQHRQSFYFEAAGFSSSEMDLNVVNRPSLSDFNLELEFPTYIGRKDAVISNNGAVSIPEGTKIRWVFRTKGTEEVKMQFGDEEIWYEAQIPRQDRAIYERSFKESTEYEIKLKNRYSENRELLKYPITVIKDAYPQIEVSQFQDTVYYDRIFLNGKIIDDHGFKNLSLSYTLTPAKSGQEVKHGTVPINFDRSSTSQPYYLQWGIQDLGMGMGDKLEYKVTVWDNDGINGSKSTSTGTYSFQIPDRKKIEESLDRSTEKVENKISNALSRSKELQQELKELKERLKPKNKLDWQDKKAIEDLLEKQEQLKKEIEELKEQNQSNKTQEDQFKKFKPETQKKIESLNKLMDELLDEETKKLMEELEKLLQEQANDEEVKDKLDELQNDETNLENELERALELFKQLKFEKKLEETSKKLDELAKKQEEAAENTADKKSDQGEKIKEQDQLNKEFEDIKKDLESLEKMNDELKDKNELDLKKEEKAAEEAQKESSDNLKKGKNSKAADSQESAAEEMKKMSQKMKDMQSDMAMSSMQENLDGLRDILENLITLSFDQEQLMKDFRGVSQIDPRYVSLSQEQLKLQADAKMIEDSLISLSKKVYQIESVVTREVRDMNHYMNQSIDHLRERQPYYATAKQQYVMTSVNNLALLLGNMMEQMQNDMANAKPGEQNCSKPGAKGKPGKGKPSMSEMQQQINQQISEMKNGKGKGSGKGMSQQLAKMAAQQEMLRNALRQLEKDGGKDGKKLGGNLQELAEKMEQTEQDLVNKKISQEMLLRQEEILTRLLDAENADRERDIDEKREAEQAKERKRITPPAFDDYIRQKERQTELLKTVDPALRPYYKKEANKYFERLND